ncbi:acyl carrier protein [Pontibacter sp. CAU 1760]
MLLQSTAIEKEVIRIISRTKRIEPARLQAAKRLEKDFGFETLDVVDIILALEKSFGITIPDEVPIHTVGDFIDYVASHTYQQAG